MKRKLSFLFLSIHISLACLLAQKQIYPVNQIQPDLLKNVHTVVRNEQITLTVKDQQTVTFEYSVVKTILNKNGIGQSVMPVSYNPFQKIMDIKGVIYDENGKKIRNINNDEIFDYSDISEFSLYEKNRTKLYKPEYLIFPFTIEYQVKLELKQTLSLPGWLFNDYNVAVEKAEYNFIVPATLQLKYKTNLLKNNEFEKSQSEGFEKYKWTIKNLPAQIEEPLSVQNETAYPYIKVALNQFVVDKTTGENSSWKSFGNWSTSLLKGKNNLPETTILEIRKLTEKCATEQEKIKIVYDYVQKKTRYVSIQIGIGGWEPFDALTVDKVSYGDCKALTNYTLSLLEAVGVKAYYTLIKGDSEDNYIDTSFVSNQFNHVVLSIPSTNDTTWLECTSQRLPTGFQGSFTDDRLGLIIDGDNSRLIRSKKYEGEANSTLRVSEIKFEDIKYASAEIKTKYTGIAYENMLGIYFADNVKKIKMVESTINIPSFTLIDVNQTENRDQLPYLNEIIHLRADNLINNQNGDINFLPVGCLFNDIDVPARVRNRKTSFTVLRPLIEIDSVQFHLPKGLTVSFLPENEIIESEFGKYSLSRKAVGEKVNVYRSFKLNEGVYTPEKYEFYREFLEKIIQSDNKMIELKKN